MSTRGIDVTFFLVKDMKRARAFYDALFEKPPTTVMSEDYWSEYEFGDGSTFAVAFNPGAEWRGGSGLLLGVDGLDAAAERVKSAGGTVTGVEMGGRTCKAKECIDTEGNYLYLHELFEK